MRKWFTRGIAAVALTTVVLAGSAPAAAYAAKPDLPPLPTDDGPSAADYAEVILDNIGDIAGGCMGALMTIFGLDDLDDMREMAGNIM